MSNIINTGRTPDSIKYNKSCCDFISLEDGTIIGESKYCNRSTTCRQVDILGAVTIPMESDYLPITNPITGEVMEWEYFCTGMYDLRPVTERVEDNKVS